MPVNPAADDGDRRVGMQLVQCCPQSFGVLEFSNGIGEFSRAGHCCRHRSGAADRIDEVVVIHHKGRCQLDLAITGVDPLGGVDDQLDALAEQGAVVDGGGAATGGQLMQPDSLDEYRTGVQHGDVEVGAQPQMVGGQCAGVSAADHDDVSALGGHCCLLFSRDVLPSRHRCGGWCDSAGDVVTRLTSWRRIR